MSTKTQLIIEIIVFVVGLGAAAYKLNSDFKANGRLSFFGSLSFFGILFLQCWMSVTSIFIPAGFLHNQVLFTLGVVFMAMGLFALVISIRQFNDVKKLFGAGEPFLMTRGIYHFSRHPQYVGYVLLISGMAMAWWNHYAIVAIITSMMMVYVLVIVEEKHLNRTFGQAHNDYCQSVKRFL